MSGKERRRSLAFIWGHNSIGGLLGNYATQTIVIVALSSLIWTGAYSIRARETKVENDTLFLVNGFYKNIQELRDATYSFTYTTTPTPDEAVKLRQQAANILRVLEQMKNLSVSVSFHRHVEDLTILMEQYLDSLEELITSRRSPDRGLGREALYYLATANGKDAYYKMEHMYQVMAATFHNVYAEVTAYAQRLSSHARGVSYAYLSVAVLAYVLLFLYSSLTRKQVEAQIVRPIQDLEGELFRMDLDHFANALPVKVESPCCEDVAFLVDVYNRMVEKIQGQLKDMVAYSKTELALKQQEVENLRMVSELKKAQLSNLQSQMNPHFLFNTLNMIAQSAYMFGDEETVSLLSMTSDLLRYSLDYAEKAVTLGQEIEMLGNYVTIQEHRFGSRLRFVFDLEEGFHDVRVPNLILQPLVENAIIHGVGSFRDGGIVTIRTRFLEKEGLGEIEVEDNGVGMEKDRLQEVTRIMCSGRVVTGKDGLPNIYLRLSLFFEQKASMQVSSARGKGTKVRIRVPYRNGD